MLLEIQATADIDDVVIESIEMNTPEGTILVDWDSSEILRTNSGFEALYRGVYFNGEYEGMANYDFEWVKHPWDYEEFYKFATKPADIFLCYENGCFYLPGGNELFGWRDSPSEIRVNRYILDVILAVLSYNEFQRNHKILMEDKQYDISYMTREYYNSLDLPFGMKKNNLDFERVMSYAHDPCKLDKMKNSEFADLPKYIWKEDMKKTG
ncbi:hypothetical protein NSB24_01200 [Blautia coccoides]|uniref:hypothetical protein n=1 Tax=Blautia producta TaxID=33035 RepID=UPI00214A82F5|nr:hypothetical protein [Blautia coccoides]MCR1984850.1 hypothetical protein [Blautia coccoides]